MSSDEFHLFSTYLYLFGNKCVKSKLSIFLIFLMNKIIQFGSMTDSLVDIAIGKINQRVQ
jgi:hypothetical protein